MLPIDKDNNELIMSRYMDEPQTIIIYSTLTLRNGGIETF